MSQDVAPVKDQEIQPGAAGQRRLARLGNHGELVEPVQAAAEDQVIDPHGIGDGPRPLRQDGVERREVRVQR